MILVSAYFFSLIPFCNIINNDFIKKVGNNIKKYRELKNITQMTLSFHAGIGLSTLASVETARNDITLSKIAAIADVLGVEPYELLK